MTSPSKTSVRKARLAAAFHNCKRDREYCRPLLITPQSVVFRYGGYEVKFVYDTGRICRVESETHFPYLQEEDYVILRTLAGDLMQAAFNGVKKPKKNKSSDQFEMQLKLGLSGLPPAGTP